MQKSQTLCLATLDAPVLRIANAGGTAAACINVTCERSRGSRSKRRRLRGEQACQKEEKSTDKPTGGQKAPTRQREKAPPYYLPMPLGVWGSSEI